MPEHMGMLKWWATEGGSGSILIQTKGKGEGMEAVCGMGSGGRITRKWDIMGWALMEGVTSK